MNNVKDGFSVNKGGGRGWFRVGEGEGDDFSLDKVAACIGQWCNSVVFTISAVLLFYFYFTEAKYASLFFQERLAFLQCNTSRNLTQDVKVALYHSFVRFIQFPLFWTVVQEAKTKQGISHVKLFKLSLFAF